MLNINLSKFFFKVVLISLTLGFSSCKKGPSTIRLIPFPKEVMPSTGDFNVRGKIRIFVTDYKDDIFTAGQLQKEIKAISGVELPVETGLKAPEDIPHCIILSTTKPEIVKVLLSRNTEDKEAYMLSIEPEQILIQSTGKPGLFYGVQTMRQIVRSELMRGRVPGMVIRDWPTLKWRGILDDVTRGPSPLLETLKREVRIASYAKLNFLTFNQEEQFAFKKHPDIGQTIAPTGLMTPEELKELNEYAKRYHVTVIAMENSFGHQNDILKLNKYKHLRENSDVLSPSLNETYSFLNDLYSSMIPYTDAPFFNVGCDEVEGLDNTKGPAKKMVEKYGVGGTYARHLRRLHNLVKENYGKRIMMWGDIILNHPDKLDLIPKDVIMLTWGYEARESFYDQITPFSESGYDFFVCPGVSCWSRIPPDFGVANTNIRNFVRDGVERGAMGMMNTMWDDNGENLFNLNWHGIIWGAECAWTGSKTDIKDFNSRIGAVLFNERGRNFGDGIELLTEAVKGDLGATRKFWNCRAMLNGWNKPPYPVPEELYKEAREKIRSAQEARRKDILKNPEKVRKTDKKILNLIERAIAHFRTTKKDGTVNTDIIDYFIFGAKRLEILANQELGFIQIERARSPEQKGNISKQIREKFVESKEGYKELWNRESKPYGLSWVLNRYDGVLNYYDAKIESLQVSKGAKK